MDNSIQSWMVIEAIRASWKELLFGAGALVYLTASFIRELRISHFNVRRTNEDYCGRGNAKARGQVSKLG